jgi:hypothetical protein
VLSWIPAFAGMTNIDVINDAIYIFFSTTDKKGQLSSKKIESSEKPLLALLITQNVTKMIPQIFLYFQWTSNRCNRFVIPVFRQAGV